MSKVSIIGGSEHILNLTNKELYFINKHDIIFVNKSVKLKQFRGRKRYVVATDFSFIKELLENGYNKDTTLVFRNGPKVKQYILSNNVDLTNVEIYAQSYKVEKGLLLPDYEAVTIEDNIFLNKGASSACMALLYAGKKKYKEIYLYGISGHGKHFEGYGYSKEFFKKNIECINEFIKELEKNNIIVYNLDRTNKFKRS